MRLQAILFALAVSTATALVTAARVAVAAPAKVVTADDPQLYFAPYVWKPIGAGPRARREAAMPGAYLRACVTGTAKLELVVDGSGNQGCPPHSMPTIEYSVDNNGFQSVPLSRSDGEYRLSLAKQLDPATIHSATVIFRSADLTADRWRSPRAHLVVAGIAGDVGMQLRDVPKRPKLAIGFGDSITEGVGVDGLFTSWQKLAVNNARATWFPLVATALHCEYGQLGSGGQGLVMTRELPPLGDTWDLYDPQSPRLTEGRLLPEPDYIFCAMGTNDPGQDIHDNYVAWMTAMRKACPNAHFFCVVPPLGVHAEEVARAVETRHRAGDRLVHLVDLAASREQFRVGAGATQLALDGVHPTVYGQAVLAAAIAAEAQRALSAAK